MSLQSALLASVLYAPDDDMPRLVYADWLDENGDPARAEFIRVQIALARLTPEAPKRIELLVREKALLADNSRTWAEPLRGLGWCWRFRRGFIEEIQTHHWFQRETVPALERVTAVAPIRMLSIFDDSPDGEALVAAAPFMARLRELRFEYSAFHYSGFGSDHMQTLLTSPHVSGLKKLYVVGGRNWGWLSKKALRAIITSPSLTGLTDLTLVHDWHGLSGDLIRVLARSPRKANLERLSLFGSKMSPELMRELGFSRYLGRLIVLDFRDCDWQQETWQALLEAPLFPKLKRLYLYRSSLVNADGRYLGNVGCTGCHDWQPNEPLRQAIISRFGESVVDFASEHSEPPGWEGWEKWEEG